uniref:Spen paralogue and orthologue SPOC C-terminal domain-containing protein n=1 Tax=Fagus sylvatica TaxID=28930 RepID=A0A2N9FVJ0_FAGSY
MHTPKSLQGALMENKMQTPHSGTSESSRKRKFVAVDKHTPFLNQIMNMAFLKSQGCNMKLGLGNTLPSTQQTCNGYFYKNGAEKISIASSSVLPQPFHYRVSPLSKVLDGETPTVSNWRPQTYDMFIQTKKHKTLPVLKSCAELAGEAEFGPGLQDVRNSECKNYFVKENQALEVCNSSSDLRPLGPFQHSLVKHDRLATDLDRKECSFQASQDGTCDLKKSGQTSSSAGINVTSTVGPGSLLAPACVEQKNENDMPLQNELQFASGPLGIGLGDNCKKENGRGHEDSNIQLVKKVEGSDVENCRHSLEETSPRNGSCPAAVNIRHDLTHGSLKSDEKRKLLVKKVAPTVAEKLWDGSLQLNSSVNVFAVAFFKSGEKMPNIKWCESVEVKGKVRLDAFEKYIQDLPRSRNRGLMVISLRWKEGSSETGLAGMKKVAKGYKEGERVGFAQLRPGIDLYICPHSETIITILAKHGFFKGMAAVEDNQDSLIGCVVWRRNRANSNTEIKKSKKKSCSSTEQLVNSPPDSSMQRVAENNLSHTQPAEESIPVASGTDNSVESKNLKPSNAQLEFHNPSTSPKPLPTPSVPSNSLSVSVGFKTSCSDCVPHQGSLGQSLEVEAPQMHNSGQEKPKPSMEVQRPVLSLPSDVTKKVAPMPDDDDLPEFDFGTSSVQTAESLIVNHRRLGNSNIAKLPLGSIQVKTPLKNFYGCRMISGFPILEKKNTAQTIAVTTPGSTTAVPYTKSLFYDDDMPEWCPPIELHKHSVRETNRPSTTSINFKVPNSTFESSPAPPNPLLPYPSLAAFHPPFATRTLPPRAYNCHNAVTVRPVPPRPAVGHMQRVPTSLVTFNSNPILRPTLNTFDVKLPIHPAGWRGWR